MFIRAIYYREKKTVHYFDENGEETLYIGGSFAWRMNNPGNVGKPGKRLISSAIGYAQRISSSPALFIIFPDKATGDKERIRLIRDEYGGVSIASMMEHYAPRKDHNNTDAYIADLCRATGTPSSTIVGQLNRQQFDAMLAAMEKREGYNPGKIVFLGKPKNLELRDMMQQPLAGQLINIESGNCKVEFKTDSAGGLPLLYPQLFTDDISVYLGTSPSGMEKIGVVSPEMAAPGMTFVAPYFSTTIRTEAHETTEKTAQKIYIVKKNDTLQRIASVNGVTVDAIVVLNKLVNKNKIFERQHLKIPPKFLAGASTESASQGGNSRGHERANRTTSQAVTKPTNTTASGIATTTASPPASGLPTAVPAKLADKVVRSSKVLAQQTAIKTDQQRTDKNHPITVLSTPVLEVSGPAWCDRFLGSKDLDSLNPDFREKAKRMISALEAVGVKVQRSAAFRPMERSYLMYYAFRVCRGDDVMKIPQWPGVHIDWAHRNSDGSPNVAAAKAAAEKMCKKYQINPASSKQQVGKAGRSRHNYGAAIDIDIGSNYIGKNVVDGTGHAVVLASFESLKNFGKSFGVIYYSGENMHWSDSGR
jgi:LysM repeat protein